MSLSYKNKVCCQSHNENNKYLHRLEGRVREVRLQDVFDGDNVVMFEVLEYLQLS